MPVLRVGMRRLYEAVGCVTEAERGIVARYELTDGTHVEVYLGQQPVLGLWIHRVPDHLVPGQTWAYKPEFIADASAVAGDSRKLYLEIRCWDEVAFSEHVYSAFESRKSEAHDPVFLAVDERRPRLEAAADLVAGTIALRFHSQLATRPACDGLFAETATRENVAQRVTTPAVRVFERVCLHDGADQQLARLAPLIDGATQSLRSAPSVLAWLMRAWSTDDPLAQFMALFTPLEMLLEGIGGAGGEDQRDAAIRELILGDPAHDVLLPRFDYLAQGQRPGLAERFRLLAQRAEMPGWERDVAAFRRFNATRNSLLHRGEAEVHLAVPVGEDEVRQLQDLVERYVSYRLFGDATVYSSCHRWTRRPQLT
jgi:hypothetical protein